MRKSPFKRYLGLLLSLIAGYLISAAILNTSVDPYGYIRAPWAWDTVFDDYRDVTPATRIGKAAIANQGHWTAAIFGSSRMEMGVSTNHEDLRSYNTANLAMPAAFLNEVIPAIDYTLNRNPDLELVLMGFEVGDLSSKRDLRAITNFYQSPFADNNKSIERLINSTVGWTSFEESIETIKRYLNEIDPVRNRYGYNTKPKDPLNIRRQTELGFRMNIYDPPQPYGKWGPISEEKRPSDLIQQLLELLIRMRREGIEVHILLPPVHALKLIHPETSMPESIAWEHEILILMELCEQANAITEAGPQIQLWSFLTFNEYTTEPMPSLSKESQRLKNWFDLGHSRKYVGQSFTSVVMNDKKDNDIGVELLSSDWSTYKKVWLEAHAKYYKSAREDISWYLNAGGSGGY